MKQRRMKTLTHRSTNKMDSSSGNSSKNSDSDSDGSDSHSSTDEDFKSSEEPEVQWFTTVLDDSEVDLTGPWKIMDDFVYMDDIPSSGNIPAIQASSLCGESHVDHQFFRGQKVYIHYPLSEYKEEYALFLPKSDTQFNPFDEMGKVIELVALTFFPERECQMIVNYDNPADCVIGRYIRAFELYDEAQALIEKNTKLRTAKPKKAHKRRRRFRFSCDLSKDEDSIPVLDNDRSDLTFGSHWRKKKPTKKRTPEPVVTTSTLRQSTLSVESSIAIPESSPEVKLEPSSSEEQLSLLPTPSEGSVTPSLEENTVKQECIDYSKADPLPSCLWDDPYLEPAELVDADGLKPLGSNEMELIEGITRCIDEFNTLVDQLRNEGSTFNVIRSRTSVPRTLVYELLNQCYSRTVLPECRKLKGYKAFSSRTYGELMPSFLTKIYEQVGLSKDMKFIDLGSGVGNCTIQAALEFGADAYGVEIMKNASELADQQLLEFGHRCKVWGIKPGAITLLGNQSFTENPTVKAIVDQCHVLLINNYLFDHELNEKIVDLLQDIKVGTKIISLKPIVPVGYMTTWTSSMSILDRMKTTKHVYGENSVSWTFSGGYYFITEVMAEVTDDNFTVLRKRGLQPSSGKVLPTNLNAYTNNV